MPLAPPYSSAAPLSGDLVPWKLQTSNAQIRCSTCYAARAPVLWQKLPRCRLQHLRPAHFCQKSSSRSPKYVACACGAGGLAESLEGDLLRAELDDGTVRWLEVHSNSTAGGLKASSGGEIVRLIRSVGDEIVVRHEGYFPTSECSWVESYPGWGSALSCASAALQRSTLDGRVVTRIGKVFSYRALEEELEQRPEVWCEGTGPLDAPLTELQSATLTAGELIALLKGKRGVVMVQLWAGWRQDAEGVVGLQPCFRPYVARLLRSVADRPDIAVIISRAAGGLGLTAVVTAKIEPFRSYGRHLASFGAQASLVADSTYYKLLVGRLLGYNHDNIVHHVEAGGGCVTQEIAVLVEADLRAVCSVRPRLPWTASNISRKRSTGGTVGKGFGGRSGSKNRH